MSTDVTMPALGESVTEGTVTTWLKQVGDTVEVDEPLLEVSTDKVDSEVPSPVAGTLLEILVQEDEDVEVGAVLARIGDASEAGSASAPAQPAPAEEAKPEPEPEAPKAEESAPQPEPVKEPETAPAPAPASGPVSGTEVTMPALGESVTEGTVTSWLKKVGDKVEADESLLEVSTDKVDSEVPSPVSGYLAEIRVQEDEDVEVGAVLAVITENPPAEGGSAPAAPAPAAEPEKAAPTPEPEPAKPAPEPAKPAPEAPKAPQPPASPAPAAPPAPKAPEAPKPPAPKPAEAPKASSAVTASAGYVTPIVRKLAHDKGVDLSALKGTGVGGRITREDVEKAATAPAPAASAAPATPVTSSNPLEGMEPSPLRGTTEKMSRLRQTIARRMFESIQSSAQLTTVVEVDVTKIASLRAKAKNGFLQRQNTKLTFLPFFVKAVIQALPYHPKVNASINDKEVTYHDRAHIGIAVDTPRGLLVPVIKNADDMSIAQIAHSINDLAERTRDSKIGPDELTGSTITITNTGSGGALFDTPILNMPETAILGVGTIQKRPAVVKDGDGNEAIAIRSKVYLALSYDHRLVDGGDAARFLMTVKKLLEEGDYSSEVL